MKLYKLTDEHNQTYDNTQWGENITHNGTGIGTLCSKAYIHAYVDPILAVMMNPVHGKFKNPNMWEAEGEISVNDGLKVGCISLTTLRRIPLPKVMITQQVAFSILSVLTVLKDSNYIQWANNWLLDKDRTSAAALLLLMLLLIMLLIMLLLLLMLLLIMLLLLLMLLLIMLLLLLLYAAIYADAAAYYAATAASDAAYSAADAASIDFVTIAHEAMKY